MAGRRLLAAGHAQDTLESDHQPAYGAEAIVDDIGRRVDPQYLGCALGTALVFFIAGWSCLRSATAPGCWPSWVRCFRADLGNTKARVLGGLLAIFVLAPLLVWLFRPRAGRTVGLQRPCGTL